MRELEGKVAVVTGAASGIGRALAHRFARAGMEVVLADVEEAALRDAADTVGALGAGTTAVVTDVSDEGSVNALRDACLSRFGAVHLVCNNAGVGDRSETIAEWHWVMGVNFWGVVHGMRAFVPLLVDQNEGHVVNTASVSGLAPAYGSYAASKWAVVALTEGLFDQLRVNGSAVGASCLCPGFVNTNIARADRNRPSWAVGDAPPTTSARERLAYIAAGTAGGLDPGAVADLVHDAVVSGRFWVYPHPDAVAALRPRVEAMLHGENPPVPAGSSDANGLFERR